jgi:hypothetical protein
VFGNRPSDGESSLIFDGYNDYRPERACGTDARAASNAVLAQVADMNSLARRLRHDGINGLLALHDRIDQRADPLDRDPHRVAGRQGKVVARHDAGASQ